MADQDIAGVMRDALLLTVKLGLPPLLGMLAAGLLIAVLQAVTQINEATLSFLPKAAALGIVLALGGAWMGNSLDDFTRMLFDRMIAVGG